MAHICHLMGLGIEGAACYSEVMPLARHEAAIYRIDLQGALDHSWSEEMGGLSIQLVHRADGEVLTQLSGTLTDQSALAGVLNLACSLGMPVLLVQFLGPSELDERING
jgi:hypothetical protein